MVPLPYPQSSGKTRRKNNLTVQIRVQLTNQHTAAHWQPAEGAGTEAALVNWRLLLRSVTLNLVHSVSCSPVQVAALLCSEESMFEHKLGVCRSV